MTFHGFVDAASAILSTSLDQILAVAYLYVDKSKNSKYKYTFLRILLGQYIGLLIIISLAFLGLSLETDFPIKYVNLIGFFPLGLGSYYLYQEIHTEFYKTKDDSGESNPLLPKFNLDFIGDEDEDIIDGNEQSVTQNYNTSTSGSMSYKAPKSPGKRGLIEKSPFRLITVDENVSDIIDKGCSFEMFPSLKHILHIIFDRIVIESLILSLICGSDNIVIYMQFFTGNDVETDVISIILFSLLLLFNAAVGYAAVNSAKVISSFNQVSHYLVPILLIGIGIDILSASIIWP